MGLRIEPVIKQNICGKLKKIRDLNGCQIVYLFSDSGLHMSHFDSCQLTLIWLAHITLNYCQPNDSPALRIFVFYVELVTVTYYISLYVEGNDWS